MTKITEILSPTQGLVGYSHEIELEPQSVIVFQLPRATNMLSDSYIEGALRIAREALPPGRKAMVIGADVNIYEISGPEATVLRLKGLI